MSRSDIISIFHCLSLEDPSYSTILSFLVAGKCLLIPDDECECLTADCGEYKIVFSGGCSEGPGLRLTVFECAERKVPSFSCEKKNVSVPNWTPYSWFEEYNGYKVEDCSYKICLPDQEDNFTFVFERFLKRSFLVDKAGIRMEKEFCDETNL
jgi:hypothetical protein